MASAGDPAPPSTRVPQLPNATGVEVPGASADVAKVYLQVDWKEKVPPKWTVHLEKALQSWANETKTFSLHNVQPLNDGTLAEVEITPSSALSKLKEMRRAELNFKGLSKEKIQVHFLMDEPKSVNRAPAWGRRVDEKKLQIPNQVGITSVADLQQFLPEAPAEFMKPGMSHFGNHLPVTGHSDSTSNSYREVQEAAGAKATSPGPTMDCCLV